MNVMPNTERSDPISEHIRIKELASCTAKPIVNKVIEISKERKIKVSN